MIAIPFKTIQQIDAALASPNMKAMRRTLDEAAKHMRPFLDLRRRLRTAEL